MALDMYTCIRRQAVVSLQDEGVERHTFTDQREDHG